MASVLPACGMSFFNLSHGLIRVCEINRIYHWCPVGTGIFQPESLPFLWETRLALFPTERWTRGLGFLVNTEHK